MAASALAVALGSWALGAAAGCSDGDGGSQGWSGPSNTCGASDECPAKSACNEEIGRCVMPDAAAGKTYYVEVRDPAGGRIPEQVLCVTLDDSAKVPDLLEVYASRQVTLRIRFEGEDQPDTGVTVIVADAASAFPGEAPLRSIYEIGPGEDLVADLLPGEGRYRIKVVPAAGAAEFPPRYLDDLTVTADGALLDAADQPLEEIVILEASSFVNGTVRRGSQPVSGLTLEAVDAVTGRSLSTRATTGCPGEDTLCNAFSLGLSPGVTDYSLWAYREGESWYPEVIRSGYAVDTDTEVVDFALDPLGTPVRYQARVEREVTLADGRVVSDGLAGCYVVFESDSVGGGTAVRTAVTDESGAIVGSPGSTGVDLYPASYKMTVVPAPALPDADADLEVLYVDRAIDLSGAVEITGQVFTLGARPRLAGVVTAGQGGVPQSAVSATPLPDAPIYNRASSGFSDGSGAFSFFVDSGRFRLVVVPPAESGFAPYVGKIQVVGDLEANVALPLPATAEAVLASGDVDVAGLVTEWYEEMDGRAYYVGRGVADANGRVIALLNP